VQESWLLDEESVYRNDMLLARVGLREAGDRYFNNVVPSINIFIEWERIYQP
jgi:hypothetical protein